MGKAKKKSADNVRWNRAQSKQNTQKKEIHKNPFEVHINKQKHKILGRKTKHDKGLPGVSRSKAIKKRKETLLVEFKSREKSNIYKDSRFGEKDATISIEDKMLERFAIEQKKKHNKMDIFNLSDNEELTHMGQSLSDGSNLKDAVENDTTYSDEEPIEQFGGMFTKKNQNNERDEQSQSNVIDEIIAKSKKNKYEQQVAKDMAEELREKLDNSWKDVKSLLSTSYRTQQEKDDMKSNRQQDNYDLAVRQMMFDRKGMPSERAKSEAEMAKEQQELKAKLNAERLRRMQPAISEKPTHRSADELCNMESKKDDDVTPILYDQDGKLLIGGKHLPEAETNTGLDEVLNSEDGDSPKSDDDEVNSAAEEEDNYSDVEDGFDEVMNDLEQELKMTKSHSENNLIKKVKPIINIKTFKKDEDTIVLMLLNCQQEDLSKTVHEVVSASGKSSDFIKVFRVLWKLAYSLGCQGETSDIDTFVAYMYNIASSHVTECAKFAQTRLRLLYDNNTENPRLPTLGNIIELKLIKLLWCTSDYRHPVTTSALAYIGHVLYLLRAKTLNQLGILLLVSTLAYDYVCFSKRFVPEVIYCLTRSLHTTLPKPLLHKLKLEKSMQLFDRQYSTELLVVEDKNNFVDGENINIFRLLVVEDNPDLLKTKIMISCLKLAGKFIELYSDLPSFPEISSHLFLILQSMQKVNWHCKIIQSTLDDNMEKIAHCYNTLPKLEYLSLLTSKRPKMLKLLDPLIDEHVGEPFQKRSAKGASRNKKEQDRLVAKHRREIKGAVREIRKDAKFLANEKINEQMVKDTERAAKVKRLYGLLANQEGEVKSLQRKKFKLDLN